MKRRMERAWRRSLVTRDLRLILHQRLFFLPVSLTEVKQNPVVITVHSLPVPSMIEPEDSATCCSHTRSHNIHLNNGTWYMYTSFSTKLAMKSPICALNCFLFVMGSVRLINIVVIIIIIIIIIYVADAFPTSRQSGFPGGLGLLKARGVREWGCSIRASALSLVIPTLSRSMLESLEYITIKYRPRPIPNDKKARPHHGRARPQAARNPAVLPSGHQRSYLSVCSSSQLILSLE